MKITLLKNLKYLVVISLITFFIWWPLLDMVLQWEGYMYLIPGNVYESTLRNIGTYASFFNLQGLILGALMTSVFGTQMEYYFAFEIGSILITNIAFFYLVKILLKNSFSAFLATIIFASNYFALADIHQPNLYSGVFLERLPINIPLLFTSFMLLHKYLERNKLHFYVFSIVLYLFSIFITHFSIFFAFPFFLYPFFFRLQRSLKFKSSFSGMWTALPYILIVLFFLFIDNSSPVPKIGLFEFLSTPKINRYPEAIVRQLVSISQFPIVIKALLSGSPPLAFNTPHELTSLILPTLIVYTAGFMFVYVKNERHRALLFTILCATLAMFFLNTFIATRLNVLEDAGSNRYFFVPSILVSVFWALVLTTVFAKKYIVTIAITLVFFVVNEITFRQHFMEVLKSTGRTQAIIYYISQNITRFPQKSLIIVGPSSDFGPYEANFFTYHIGRDKNITFKTEDVGYSDWPPLASSAGHLIYLNYEKKCHCVHQKIVK